MDSKCARARKGTSFGFIVLVLVYQRAYSSYTSVSMDYQIALAATSALAWIALLVFGRRIEQASRAWAGLSFALLMLSFCGQELFILQARSTENEALLYGSTTLFSIGFALYCRLWLAVYEGKPPRSTLVYLAGSSALSAVVACLPPLLLGFDAIGAALAFAMRLGVVCGSFWCLAQELSVLCPDDAHGQPIGAGAKPSEREAWSAVKLVIVAVLASRFVQGLLVLNEAGYRDYGAQILLIASPLVSILIVLIVRKLGTRPGFVSSFYWSLVTCSLIVLLVSAAVSDSSIGFLWVLLFAVYAQMDVAFMGILASLASSFGSSFRRLTCLAFAGKDLVFVLGRVLRGEVDVPVGSFVCVAVLLAATVFEIVVYLLQTYKNSHERDEPTSVPEALSLSIGSRFELTPRENDVLLALLQGRSYTNIGHKLFISKSTVKTHANHIYAKLGVSSRDELIDLLDPPLVLKSSDDLPA